ncbi:MAG: PIN domain-containing protein [Thermoanaerobaculum sp.]
MTGVWIDANVLLRFLTGTPPELAARARTVMEKAERGEVVLRVSSVVAAEVVWVLCSVYKLPKAKVAATLGSLFVARGVELEDQDAVLPALAQMAEHNVDFADALLAQRANQTGEPVASFDEDFRRLGVDTFPV